MRVSCFLFAAGLSALLFASAKLFADKEASESGEGPSAPEILSKMAEVYRGCHSYRDRGEVKSYILEGGSRRMNQVPFHTYFKRPCRLRFNYKLNLPIPGARGVRGVVWTDGQEFKTWTKLRPEVKEEKSLGDALESAVGGSGSASMTVPALLLPKEVGKWNVAKLHEPKRVEDKEMDDGNSCYRVQGKFNVDDSGEITLWIDKNTHLIRRMDTLKEFDSRLSGSCTFYDPEIDAEIAEEDLSFNFGD